MTYRVPPALSTRLRFQFHPQPYFLFIISLQSHQPSCCSSELPHLLSLATPLIICSTYVLAWLMPSLLGSQLNAITSKKSPLITLLSCSLSPWHALFSHSTYPSDILMCLCACFPRLHTECGKAESVLFIIPSSSGIEK